jgi:NitT/TauT family transport system permease protein
MATIQRAAGMPGSQQLRRILPPLVFLAILAAIWQVGAEAAGSILLPTFSQTVGAFADLLVGGALWEPLARSNVTMFVGFFISAIVGVPLGLILGRRRLLDQAAAPWIAVLVVLPASALLPIIVMMIGFDIAGGVAVVILFALVYITVNTRAGIRSIEPHLVEMAYSYGAGEVDIWRYVLIPGALPAIATGLRIGLGRAFSGMVLAELLLFASGIGLLILQYRGQFAADHLFAVVLALLVEAVLLGFAMRWLERRVQSKAG